MRKMTNKGTDVALILPSGSKIRHGDVILVTKDKLIIVELEPEDVIMVKVLDNIHADEVVKLLVKIGHTIGNLHRPLKVEGRIIYFPIQSESEIGMFQKLLSSAMDHLEIKCVKMVFEPEEGLETIEEHYAKR
jgi:urease accessory protein